MHAEVVRFGEAPAVAGAVVAVNRRAAIAAHTPIRGNGHSGFPIRTPVDGAICREAPAVAGAVVAVNRRAAIAAHRPMRQVGHNGARGSARLSERLFREITSSESPRTRTDCLREQPRRERNDEVRCQLR
jgi:hypothetical protein